MKAPLSWLRDYVDINVSTKEYADALTMSGSKVEGVEEMGEEISNVVVGKILSIEKHPDADRLQVTQVDVSKETIQIVTGAQNIKVGDYIPVALIGANLPNGIKIKKGKLRGIESCGMMCSIAELNLTKDDFPNAVEDGIFILEDSLPMGEDIKKVLGLDEKVVEFEITSNRPDCFSILGLARESAVTLDTGLKKPEIVVKEEADEASQYVSVEIENPELCSRYAARIVKDVKIEPSPKWMRSRLKAAGVRPINNIVDITNYVMLELGQPMHAFDLECISGSKIIVRTAKEGETLTTLDDQVRKIDTSMLVISDSEKSVGLAGVMGGANSEVTDSTKTLLLEAATFNGSSVRLTAKKLGLRSEASSRFEKGLDVENVIPAIDRAAQLIEQLGAGKVCKGIVDNYVIKSKKTELELRPEKINALLGTDISSEKMVEILRALEFEINTADNIVIVPSFRPDVECEADLAEEIARFYGYNNIKPSLLSGKSSTQGKKSFKQKTEDTISKTMMACGLSEIYTYSFTSPKVFDKLNIPEDSEIRNAVVISNPLGEDYSIMRTTTLSDMLEVLSRNYNRKVEEAKLFEISNIYLPKELPIVQLPEEKSILTLGMYGELDFYDIKGVVEEVLDVLGINDYEFEPEKQNSTFHPGRTAKLLINGNGIGVFGEVHPEVAEKFECPKRTYAAAIEIAPLIEYSSMDRQYKPLPKFPAINRDIAMLVKDQVLVKEIENIIKQKSGKILEGYKLFDVYKGKQVPEGMKSVAYSITFRASDRTLVDDEVNKVMKKILQGLETELKAQLRDS